MFSHYKTHEALKLARAHLQHGENHAREDDFRNASNHLCEALSYATRAEMSWLPSRKKEAVRISIRSRNLIITMQDKTFIPAIAQEFGWT